MFIVLFICVNIYRLCSLNHSASLSIYISKPKIVELPHSFHPSTDYHGVLPQKRMLRYKVKGTNPETRRRKTVYNIVLPSWKPFPKEVKGILPPYEFMVDTRPITERQQAFLDKHNLKMPRGTGLDDASVVIMHFIADSVDDPHRYFEPPLPDEIMEEAAEKGLLLPSFLSREEALLFLCGDNWRCDAH